jgi:hypothetical protein
MEGKVEPESVLMETDVTKDLETGVIIGNGLKTTTAMVQS